MNEDNFLEKMIMNNGIGTAQYFRLNGAITIREMEVMRDALKTYKIITSVDFNRTDYIKNNSHIIQAVEQDIEICDSLLKRFTDYKTIKEQ